MANMAKKLLLICLFFVALLLLFNSCVDNNYHEQNDEKSQEEIMKEMYKNVTVPLTETGSVMAKKQISFASVNLDEMQIKFEFNIKAFEKNEIPVSATKQDTFSESIFFVEYYFNNQPIKVDPEMLENFYAFNSTYKLMSDSSLKFKSDPIKLKYQNKTSISIPIYLLKNYKADETGAITIKVWQDYFLANEKMITQKIMNVPVNKYVRDTLHKTLISAEYNFAFTMPVVYKSEIICDSIILQNDKNWSPAGSDNTLWKSTYPDIYFSIANLYGQRESSSVVEHSTDTFTYGDSLSLYHYKTNESFYIDVWDHDNLSKDDLLGEWEGSLAKFENNKTYVLKFGHIAKFYFRKRTLGKLN